jgi:hypothetical protein
MQESSARGTNLEVSLNTLAVAAGHKPEDRLVEGLIAHAEEASGEGQA